MWRLAALVAEFAEFTTAWSHDHRVHCDLAVLFAEFTASNMAGAAGRGDLVAKLMAAGDTGCRVRRVRCSLVAWLQSSLQPGSTGHRVHGKQCTGAASCGDMVAKFTVTGGTGRRVRHSLVAWSQSSQQPGREVAGGSQRVKLVMAPEAGMHYYTFPNKHSNVY